LDSPERPLIATALLIPDSVLTAIGGIEWPVCPELTCTGECFRLALKRASPYSERRTQCRRQETYYGCRSLSSEEFWGEVVLVADGAYGSEINLISNLIHASDAEVFHRRLEAFVP
jgi:hypothetical protein